MKVIHYKDREFDIIEITDEQNRLVYRVSSNHKTGEIDNFTMIEYLDGTTEASEIYSYTDSVLSYRRIYDCMNDRYIPIIDLADGVEFRISEDKRIRYRLMNKPSGEVFIKEEVNE